jgi:hypothetical protein
MASSRYFFKISRLKLCLERTLNSKVTLRQGERDRIVSLATAGIEQLVFQFAQGDRHARRDLIDLAHKLGVELTAGQGAAANAFEAPNATKDEALIAEFLKRHGLARDPGADSQSPQSQRPPAPADGAKHD